MNCRRMEQLLPDYLEGLASKRETAAIEAHLGDCPSCRRRHEKLLAVGAGLRRLAHQLPIGEADVFGPAVHRWVAEREAPDESRRRRFPAPFAAMLPADQRGRGIRGARPVWGLSLGSAAAAVLLVVLALSWWGHGQRGTHRGPSLAAGPHLPRIAPLLPPNPQPPGRDDGNRIADLRPGSPGGAHEAPPAPVPPSVKGHQERARGSQPPLGYPRFLVPVADDLAYVNRDPKEEIRQWVNLRPDEWERTEARVDRYVHVREEFITIPFPRLASTSERQIARAVESYKREAAIVDPRLSQEVTCAFKATALSDLCEQLRTDTGIHLAAGPSVADEKVTLFCEKMPLRDVMRQLSRPFGYTWLRTGSVSGVRSSVFGSASAPITEHRRPNTDFRYELVQDLRSQLLEEELRNRDQNAALLDMDREMKQYLPYLNLSPDEALARAASAPPEEKKLLEYLAGKGWGPAQLYARLTPADLAALRAGQKLSFNAAPGPGAQPLPAEMAGEVMASLRDYRIVRRGDSFDAAPAKDLPDGLPPASVPEAQPMVSLSLDRSELGQLTLHGFSGFYIGTPPNCLQLMGDDDHNLAVGMSPTVRSPENAAANARFARDPALAAHVTVQTVVGRQSSVVSKGVRTAPPTTHDLRLATDGSKVTSADVLEALHRATGLPIVADYYTRLYPASQVSVQDLRFFDALNRLADTMRLRWSKDPDHGAGGRLQFRSADFYNDRLKEVPNRLLFRWAASRRAHGALTLDDLIEISQLTDAQLDSSPMAEGARVLYGLEEWDLTRRSEMRPNWRFLASLTPEQRQLAQSTSGLVFTRMSLAQQQQFLTLLPSQADTLKSLDDLREASLQVDYTVPGEFQWTPPAPDSSPARRPPPPPLVHARTRQAALQAAQRIDPQATEAQIAPTELGLTLTYRLGGPRARFTPFLIRADLHSVLATLPQPVAP